MATPAGGRTDIPRRSAGKLQTLRRQLHWPSDKDFRILSLDGGGIKGLFTLALLARLESTALGGKSIAGFFDLIAGTSTGGIIALALAAGLSAGEVLEGYLQFGGSIFPIRRSFGILRPAFDAARLRDLLSASVSDRLFGDAKVRLCVPSCEGRFGDVNVFKTPHHPDFKLDWKVPMVEVGMATSAAPTFLPVHSFGGYLYVDGGLWANNPAMVGLVDALTCFDLDRRQLRVLSIGTGGRPPALTKRHLRLGGLGAWLLDGSLIENLMQYGSINADGQAGLLVGRDHLSRFAPLGDLALIQMTDFQGAKSMLVPAGMETADQNRRQIETEFLHSTAAPAKFFHGPRAAADNGGS